MDEAFMATVTGSTGSWYEVTTASGETLRARIRGRLRLAGSRSTNPVVVGDVVECRSDDGEVWIEGVEERRNYIIRRASNLSRESHIIAANIDRALVVATLFSPATPPEFIDRFLVTCEAYEIPATVMLGKIDLARASEGGQEAIERFTDIYRSAGYLVMHASARTGEGMDAVRRWLDGQTTLVAGNSGVGKSTLIRALSPGAEIRTGEVSKVHGRGMHTTTFSQMYPLEGGGSAKDNGFTGSKLHGGGRMIDTPGIKGFGLVDIGAGELWHYFPEMMRTAPECQFYNCTHTHEPGCAVIRAVEEGTIAPERYESYLKMLDEDGKYR